MKKLLHCCIALTLLLPFALASAQADPPDERSLLLTVPGSEPLEIPLNPAILLQLLPSGNLTATAAEGFVCADEGNGECADIQVSMTSPDGSFTVSPSSVNQGGNVVFNWTSRGAWTCSGTGLPGSSWDSFTGGPPSGSSGAVSTTNVPARPDEPYVPSVTCCNGPNCVSRTVQLTVRDPGQGIEGCEDRAPPSHLTRATQCWWPDGATQPGQVDCTSWTSFFGVPFPTGSGSREVFQRPGQYLALEFETGNYVGSRSGRLNTAEAQNGFPGTHQGGDLIWTISRCPGDFNQQAIQADSGSSACYVKGQATARPLWRSLDFSGPAPQVYCPLEPNTTYYLNLVFTDSPAGTAPDDLNWACTGVLPNGNPNCGRRLQVNSQ